MQTSFFVLVICPTDSSCPSLTQFSSWFADIRDHEALFDFPFLPIHVYKHCRQESETAGGFPHLLVLFRGYLTEAAHSSKCTYLKVVLKASLILSGFLFISGRKIAPSLLEAAFPLHFIYIVHCDLFLKNTYFVIMINYLLMPTLSKDRK